MTRLLYILTILLLLSCGTKDNSKEFSGSPVNDKLKTENRISDNWLFDKIDGSKLVFKNGQADYSGESRPVIPEQSRPVSNERLVGKIRIFC